MKKTMKRAAIATLVAAGIAGGAAGVASAATVNIGGGTWTYGVGANVYSNYYHGSVCHGSSVQGRYYASSGNTRAGVWARASAPSRPNVADQAYWRNSC